MASRPVFIPMEESPFVSEQMLDFQWYAGFAVSQKQKSIAEFHRVIISNTPANNPLEISSKSENTLGVALSAFNLMVTLRNGKDVALENVFQATKIFERGGPFKDILNLTPLEAKRDPRLKESGDMTGFQGRDKIWPLEPKTLFYDWLYINALHNKQDLATQILSFDAFTDIEFNPSKSFNCQARSAALYVALHNAQLIEQVITDSNYYVELINTVQPLDSKPVQKSLI